MQEVCGNMRVRILTDWSTMPIWVDRLSKEIIIDWHGREIIAGKAIFAVEADTWMFEESDGLNHVRAPEDRHSLGTEMCEGLADRIDVAINENQGNWFNGWVDGVFVGSPSKLLMGADMDHGDDE